MFLAGLDLKLSGYICEPAMFSIMGGADEPRQIRFCSDHGAYAAQYVQALRGSLWWPIQGQALLLPGPVSVHGVRATHLSRELARHRSLPSSPECQALSSRLPQQRCPQYTGQRECHAGLAHVLRFCAEPDWDRAAALCRRTARCRLEGYGLRARFDDHSTCVYRYSLGPHSDRPRQR